MFKKILYYINPLNFFKKEKDADLNLRMMHGINKVSWLMFVVIIVILVMKWRA